MSDYTQKSRVGQYILTVYETSDAPAQGYFRWEINEKIEGFDTPVKIVKSSRYGVYDDMVREGQRSLGILEAVEGAIITNDKQVDKIKALQDKLDIAIKTLEAIAEHYTKDDPRIEKTNWNDWYEVFQNGSAVGMYLMGKDAREALKRLPTQQESRQ